MEEQGASSAHFTEITILDSTVLLIMTLVWVHEHSTMLKCLERLQGIGRKKHVDNTYEAAAYIAGWHMGLSP